VLGAPSTRSLLIIKTKGYRVEGGGRFLIFRREWGNSVLFSNISRFYDFPSGWRTPRPGVPTVDRFFHPGAGPCGWRKTQRVLHSTGGKGL
jgi:hypothetical protein